MTKDELQAVKAPTKIVSEFLKDVSAYNKAQIIRLRDEARDLEILNNKISSSISDLHRSMDVINRMQMAGVRGPSEKKL